VCLAEMEMGQWVNVSQPVTH